MRNLRVSEFGDYVAVDNIDAHGQILNTPIYLQKGKTIELFAYDVEEGRYVKANVTFDGKELRCTDKDGLKWESSVSELAAHDKGYYIFKPIP